jgi:TonB family protein
MTMNKLLASLSIAPLFVMLGVANALANPTSVEIDSWTSEVEARIEQNLDYPRFALSHNDEGTVAITFKIGDDGRPKDAHVSDGSGSSSLNLATLRAVEAADYPPLPVGFPAEQEITLTVRFDIAGGPRQAAASAVRTKQMREVAADHNRQVAARVTIASAQ